MAHALDYFATLGAHPTPEALDVQAIVGRLKDNIDQRAAGSQVDYMDEGVAWVDFQMLSDSDLALLKVGNRRKTIQDSCGIKLRAFSKKKTADKNTSLASD